MPNSAPIAEFNTVSDFLNRYRPVRAAQHAQKIYDEHPEDWDAIKTTAQCQAILGNFDRATKLLENANRLFPALADVYFEKSRLALQQRKLRESEQQIRLAKSHGLNEKRFFIQGANIAGAKNDPFSEINYLKATAELFDYKEPVSIFKYAIKSMGYNDFETGIRLNSILQSVANTHIKSIELNCWVLALNRQYTELVELLANLLNDGTHTESLLMLMNQIWIDLHYPPLLELLRNAIQTLPHSPIARLLGLKRQCVAPATTAAEVLKRDDHSQVPETISREAMEMAALGNLDEATRVIKKFSERWPRGYNVNWDEETPMVLCAPNNSALRREAISASTSQDWIVTPKGDSDKLIIVFTALNGEGFCPLNLLDRYFAADGHQVLYLRDFSGCFFLNGIKSHNHDADALKQALSEFLDRHKSLSPVFIGLSAGSFAAVRFGLDAGVKHMVQFAPLSMLGAQNSKFLSDNRGIAIKQRTDEDLAGTSLTLIDDLKNASKETRIDVLYSPHINYDLSHLAALEVFDCIYPTALEKCLRHNTLAPTITNGYLDALINQSLHQPSTKMSSA